MKILNYFPEQGISSENEYGYPPIVAFHLTNKRIEFQKSVTCQVDFSTYKELLKEPLYREMEECGAIVVQTEEESPEELVLAISYASLKEMESIAVKCTTAAFQKTFKERLREFEERLQILENMLPDLPESGEEVNTTTNKPRNGQRKTS